MLKKVIVIGAGMSGLTAAAYLARAGYDVKVFEQYYEPGGVTATLRYQGFGWDLGPLLIEGFESGGQLANILYELGVADMIRTVREDRGIVFPDFKLWKPSEYGGPYWRREWLKELFPAESKGLNSYYQFYDRLMDLFVLMKRAEQARDVTAGLLKLKMLLSLIKTKRFFKWNAQQLMDHFFHRAEIKAVYTGILADFVVKPSQFPALGIPIVNAETAFDKRIPLQVSRAGPRMGYYYIIGGIGKLVEAVSTAIVECGGRIYTNTPVDKIVVEGDQVRGVVLGNGRFEPANLVIASGGVRETFFRLIGREHLPNNFSRLIEECELMESVLMVHLGIDFNPTPYQPAALCYYYGTYDIEEGIKRCRSGEYHEGKDGFLIYIPSLHSPELAPPSHHAITIYTIAPNRLNKGTWAERREELADKLVAEAECIVPGLHERTKVRVILSPEDFKARTHLEHHAFGGISPVMNMKRPPHRTPIKGLWFIGAQSESGGGVQNVMVGARKVAHK